MKHTAQMRPKGQVLQRDCEPKCTLYLWKVAGFLNTLRLTHFTTLHRTHRGYQGLDQAVP